MTLQSSGRITIAEVRNELSNRNGSYSLRSLSSTAQKGTPDAISEFYGWMDYWTSNFSLIGGGAGG